MTYLELVNDVLIRLREDTVASVSDTSYSRLIGKYIRDAQRHVEDSYDWNSLSATLTAVTNSDYFNYVLTGAGTRFRVLDVINDTSDIVMEYVPSTTLTEWMRLRGTTEKGTPTYYNFNGTYRDPTSGMTDTRVDLFPVPDGEYSIRFNIIQPQDPLKNDTDALLVPDEPVIFLAYAKAIAERGEDAGLTTSEAYQLYQQSLAEHIAIESNRYPEELVWRAA